MSAENTRVFETVRKGHLIEVWLPPVDHPEGELILRLNESYLPELIATLRNLQTR